MISARALVSLLFAVAIPACAWGQGAILQGGPWTPGHVPQYVGQGSSQAVVQDGGGARGGAVGVNPSELGITARGTGTAPYAGQGTGPLGTNVCDYDAPTTNATGYHYLCLSPNAQGGGLLAYGASFPATALPFKFNINGTAYTFPFVTGGIVGPNTTTVGHLAVWNNTAGTLLADSTTLPALTGYISLLTSPTLSTSPTGNPTAGSLLATYSSLLLQTATSHTGNREFVTNIGMTSDIGFGSTNGNGDKVGLYVGVQAGTNSSDIWAVNFLCELKSNLNNSINNNCNETDLNNNYAHYFSLSPSVFGQINSGAGAYQSTAGSAVTGITPTIAVSGTTNAGGLVRLTVASTTTLQTGFRTTVSGVGGTTEANGVWTITVIDGSHINLQGSTFTHAYTSGGTISGPIWRYAFAAFNNTANEAAFYDFSDAKVSFSVDGAHDIGLDLRRVSFSIAPVIVANDSAYAALESDNTTVANILYLDPSNITQLGGGTAVDIQSTLRVNPAVDKNLRIATNIDLADGVTLFSGNNVNNALKGMEFGASKFEFGGGNVGIATATAAYPLDVNGDINSAGAYRQAGNVGVTCSGAPTGSFATLGGIVTHC